VTGASPAARGFAMPPEWAPHAATWMAFPPAIYGGGSPDVARSAWCTVAREITRFEPVMMMTDPPDVTAAREMLDEVIEIVPVPLDDAWARDIGPTLVSDGSSLLAVDWTFNGWGAQPWARWENGQHAAATVAAHLGVEAVSGDLVNEGGGIEVDGAGTVILTSTVQLDPDRNPGLTRDDVEARVHAALGTSRALWLNRGLAGDYLEFGTRGHVDLVVKFVAPGVALVHDQTDPSHPDHEVSLAATRMLLDAGADVIPMPAPSTREVAGRICDWSYVNCYVCNDAVILGVYGDVHDDEAAGVLRTLFPRREVVCVDARPLFALGGGVHCITQQQPV
jgi:agmatine deiminase